MQGKMSGAPVNLTSSGIVSKVPGSLLGFYVNNTSSGTIVIKDAIVTGGTAISGTITPAIGWHTFPASCATGCFVTIGSSLDVTLFFAA